jgi:hypothetical protein
VSVKRVSWAIGKPMPSVIDLMVKLLPSIINSSKVCLLCQDKSKCQTCIFSKHIDPEEFTVLEAVI